MASDTRAGQAIYNNRTLRLYDLVVLRLSNPLVWRCPTARILALYHRHVGTAHLDVGVGTGWYLDRCRFPSPTPRVGLMDLKADSLAFAAHRIARYRPEIYRVDVLGAPAGGLAPFDSIGLTYLLHCLPGDIAKKAKAFDTVRPCLRDDGVVFGATTLSGGVPVTAAARTLMRIYNRKGVFSNVDDTLPALRSPRSALPVRGDHGRRLRCPVRHAGAALIRTRSLRAQRSNPAAQRPPTSRRPGLLRRTRNDGPEKGRPQAPSFNVQSPDRIRRRRTSPGCPSRPGRSAARPTGTSRG